MGLFGNSDYNQVVKANNELRAKMEKLRLENSLLKDQVRALMMLPQELSQLYIFIQLEDSVTVDDVVASKYFKGSDKEQAQKNLDDLIRRRLIDKRIVEGKEYYSIRMQEFSEAWTPAVERIVGIDKNKSSNDSGDPKKV
ncbi:MAG: hypothetical protein JXB14_02410 [Candidatus Altiarchaeota archaeon]|nr:hypothetical protein [Candidatus Altiarchaeota archaeon]